MSSGLFAYTVRRLLWAVPVLFIISFVVFSMMRMAPGDPVDAILGARYQEEQAQRLREKYGYDDPIPVQYAKYMRNLAQGDLGISTRHQSFSVSEIIWPKMWISARLGFIAMIISFTLGISAGIYAALARGTFLDPLTISFWLAIDAIPIFVAAPFLMWLFALKLDVVGLGWEGFTSVNIILPILILSLPGTAGVARFVRASVLSVVKEDYVRTARAKGLKERTVVITHIARNALLPLITVIGLSLPGLAGGSLILEQMFGIPGIGAESFDAVLAPDFDVILALVMIGSTLFVAANILIDLMYAVIDPRIRLGATRG
jgi:ABC-type dipeptide/oligopeptide/nickel transport system permease component